MEKWRPLRSEPLDNFKSYNLKLINALFALTDFCLILQEKESFNCTSLQTERASTVAQIIKNLPAVRETWVRSLGWEVPLENRMTTQSSILAWRNPWTEEPGRLQSMGLQRVVPDSKNNTFTLSLIWKRNILLLCS